MPKKNVIVFSCDPGCVGDTHDKTCKPRSDIYLVADGTAVTLTFENGAIFDPPDLEINIEEDSFVKKKLSRREDRSKYKVKCEECDTPQDDPEIIVEL